MVAKRAYLYSFFHLFLLAPFQTNTCIRYNLPIFVQNVSTCTHFIKLCRLICIFSKHNYMHEDFLSCCLIRHEENVIISASFTKKNKVTDFTQFSGVTIFFISIYMNNMICSQSVTVGKCLFLFTSICSLSSY